MRIWTAWIGAVLVSGLLASLPADAAGSRPTTNAPPVTPEVKTPEEEAKDAYNQGLKLRDKAWALEDKAEAAGTDAERQKHLGKAQKHYTKSIRLFETATRKVPTFHQAFSSLGYALRKTGEFERSLEAYDQALKLAPFYGEAIEYRAEAYLGLDRLDEAKEAYMQLFSSNRDLADQLMVAMRRWLEKRRAEPGGVSSETIESFAAWVAERSELAEQTARLWQAARSW